MCQKEGKLSNLYSANLVDYFIMIRNDSYKDHVCMNFK